jgi:NifU-like protein
MGAEALEAAVFNWAQRRGVDLKALGIDLRGRETEEGRMVCKCFSLSEPYILRKIKELNLRTIPQITNAIKAGGACGSCHHVPGGLQDLLDQVWQGKSAAAAASASPAAPVFPLVSLEAPPPDDFSPYQFSKKVEKVVAEYVRPSLKLDGGDVEIVDIKGTIVYCRLQGACAHCSGASRTLKMMVERILKEQVDERIRVIEV